MHVGVLIKARNEEEALRNLDDDIHCFDADYDENGEEIEGSFRGEWDYCYGCLNEFWWDGKNEDSKVFSGMSSKEFAKWVEKNGHYLDKIDFDLACGLFDYYLNAYNEVEYSPDKELIEEDIEEGYNYYVAKVHV